MSWRVFVASCNASCVCAEEENVCLENLIRKGLMRKNAGDRNLLSYFRALWVSQGNAPSRILRIQHPDMGGRIVFLKREAYREAQSRLSLPLRSLCQEQEHWSCSQSYLHANQVHHDCLNQLLSKASVKPCAIQPTCSYVQNEPLEKVIAAVFPGNGLLASGWFCIINLGNWVKLVEARVVFVHSLAQQTLTYDLVIVCTVVLWKGRYPC